MTNHEINKAAEEYTDRFIPENKRCYKRYSKYCGATSSLFDVYGAFTEGAKWALEHQECENAKSWHEIFMADADEYSRQLKDKNRDK